MWGNLHLVLNKQVREPTSLTSLPTHPYTSTNDKQTSTISFHSIEECISDDSILANIAIEN